MDLDSAGQKNSRVVSLRSGKFLLSRNIRIDNNSECRAITLTEKRLKKVQSEGFTIFFYIIEVYFDVQNSNPISIFVGRDRKTSIIRKNKFFCCGLEKLFNTTLLAAETNNTLELIGY